MNTSGLSPLTPVSYSKRLNIFLKKSLACFTEKGYDVTGNFLIRGNLYVAWVSSTPPRGIVLCDIFPFQLLLTFFINNIWQKTKRLSSKAIFSRTIIRNAHLIYFSWLGCLDQTYKGKDFIKYYTNRKWFCLKCFSKPKSWVMFKCYSRGLSLGFTDGPSSHPAHYAKIQEHPHVNILLSAGAIVFMSSSKGSVVPHSLLTLPSKVKCNHSKDVWYLDWTI